MANLDSRFICTSDLDTYYVDNATGLPLSGGIVTFYSDVNRTSLKPVYQLTGTPGNYSYQPLNNPCTLSSSGTFQDALGNNIIPFYYPFTGTPEDNSGVQELYYVTVVNSGFVPQFIRQGWPQSAGSVSPTPSDVEVENYIPNGQFLAHNNIVSLTEPPRASLTFTTVAGSVAVYAQPIAQGGWEFTYSQSSTATFNNSFTTIPSSGGWGMNSFPRYIFNFNCTSIGNTPQYRDLRIIWPDVNKFSSGNPPGDIPYTLFFDAKSNDGNSYTFSLYQFYYYGTGGITDNYIENFVGSITIGPNTTFVSVNVNDILFPANESTIGSNNDDHVGLALRGPMSGWNVSVSDFLLAQGNDTFTSYPVQTNDQMLSRGVAGWMPTPDPTGLDLYLPLVLTPQGMIFDHSIVGQIIAKTELSTNPVNNELYMNGSTYLASAYSSIGIPYQRLMNYLLANSAAISNGTVQLNANIIPLTGTGANFVTLFNVTAALTTEFIVQINTTASGGSATGSGAITIAATSANNYYTATVHSVPTGGYYWSFVDGTANLTYNVWYSINGVGTAPATPTGANIQVNLTGTPTIVSTIASTLAAVNQYQFLVPNLQGLFLRGWDPNGIYDLDYATRANRGIQFNNTTIQTQYGTSVGTLELQAFIDHTHNAPASSGGQFIGTGTGGNNYGTGADTTSSPSITGTATTPNNGGTETRPVNFAVNYFIKY